MCRPSLSVCFLRLIQSISAPASVPTESVPVRASDPRLRLQRTVAGEHLGAIPIVAERVAARAQWEPPRPVVPQHERAARSGQVRPTRRTVDPSPNAPQLIRLVQHPFALETTRSKADPTKKRPERVRVGDQVRVPFGVSLRQALAAGQRQPFPMPTDLHPVVSRPARLALDAWLCARDEQ